MRLGVRVQSDVDRLLAEEVRAGERATKRGLAGAGSELKTAWRAQITGAGLGKRLAGSVRSEAYPKARDSLNAAALVWTKAPTLIDAFNRGVTIRSDSGFWLAIPTKAAGRGDGGKKITPARWEQRTGRRLRFVYRRGRTALLVDEGQRAFRRASDPVGFTQRQRRSAPRQSIVVFILVPQVRLRKRLDLDRDTARIGGTLAARILAEWRTT